jgi:hypothetical protein
VLSTLAEDKEQCAIERAREIARAGDQQLSAPSGVGFAAPVLVDDDFFDGAQREKGSEGVPAFMDEGHEEAKRVDDEREIWNEPEDD